MPQMMTHVLQFLFRPKAFFREALDHAMQHGALKFKKPMTLDRLTQSFMAGAVLTAASVTLPNKAQSQVIPYMSIPQQSAVVGDYDGQGNLGLSNPGQESKYTFSVFNNGDGNDSNNPDGSAYNLISFVLPVGTDNGVFDYDAATGWTANIGASTTTFNGNGNSVSPNFLPQNFIIYSSNTDLSTPIPGRATATASGTLGYPNQPFRDYNGGSLSSNEYVEVEVPGALVEPFGSGRLEIELEAGGGVLLRFAGGLSTSIYHLEQSGELGPGASWTVVESFPGGEELSFRYPLSPGKMFWRVVPAPDPP